MPKCPKCQREMPPTDASEPITPEWLQSIGFSVGTLEATKLIPPDPDEQSIMEISVSPCPEPSPAWIVALYQGVDDDPSYQDDHVTLTHQEYQTRGELCELLKVLGAL